jgi:hypothetical protein
MANLARVRVAWSGNPVVGPGVSTLYWDEADSGYVAKLATFFNAVKNIVTVGVVWTIPNTGDLIDVATGAITGAWTDGTSTTVSAAQSGNYAAGVGARIRWQTSGIRNGRRVRGSTFIVPITVAGYDAGGTLSTTVIDACNTAAGAVFTAGATQMKIYSRPNAGGPGQANTVLNGSCLDTVSWLRTRRT